MEGAHTLASPEIARGADPGAAPNLGQPAITNPGPPAEEPPLSEEPPPPPVLRRLTNSPATKETTDAAATAQLLAPRAGETIHNTSAKPPRDVTRWVSMDEEIAQLLRDPVLESECAAVSELLDSDYAAGLGLAGQPSREAMIQFVTAEKDRLIRRVRSAPDGRAQLAAAWARAHLFFKQQDEALRRVEDEDRTAAKNAAIAAKKAAALARKGAKRAAPAPAPAPAPAQTVDEDEERAFWESAEHRCMQLEKEEEHMRPAKKPRGLRDDRIDAQKSKGPPPLEY